MQLVGVGAASLKFDAAGHRHAGVAMGCRSGEAHASARSCLVTPNGGSVDSDRQQLDPLRQDRRLSRDARQDPGRGAEPARQLAAAMAQRAVRRHGRRDRGHGGPQTASSRHRRPARRQPDQPDLYRHADRHAAPVTIVRVDDPAALPLDEHGDDRSERRGDRRRFFRRACGGGAPAQRRVRRRRCNSPIRSDRRCASSMTAPQPDRRRRASQRPDRNLARRRQRESCRSSLDAGRRLHRCDHRGRPAKRRLRRPHRGQRQPAGRSFAARASTRPCATPAGDPTRPNFIYGQLNGDVARVLAATPGSGNADARSAAAAGFLRQIAEPAGRGRGNATNLAAGPERRGRRAEAARQRSLRRQRRPGDGQPDQRCRPPTAPTRACCPRSRTCSNR